jgi:hypothetical protein
MAEEVLSRQARVFARRTGQPLGEAREAVIQTAAGCQLEDPRREEKRARLCSMSSSCRLSESSFGLNKATDNLLIFIVARVAFSSSNAAPSGLGGGSSTVAKRIYSPERVEGLPLLPLLRNSGVSQGLDRRSLVSFAGLSGRAWREAGWVGHWKP